MGEVLCGVVSGSESSSKYRPPPRAARRRRLDVRRFRLLTRVAPYPPEEPVKKQRAADICAAAGGDGAMCPLDLNECVVDERIEDAEGPDPWRDAGAVENLCPGYGMTSVCGRRREMEDSVSIRPDFLRRGDLDPGIHFFGVFDGHGCSHVADSCKERMHQVLADEVKAGGDIPAAGDWKGVMEKSFSRMDAEVVLSDDGTKPKVKCRCELHTTKWDHMGSTAVVAVVTPDHVVVGNCGDSRAVLCRGGAAIPLSSDHKPDRPDELLRIQSAGGKVIYWDGPRVLGVLAMSRAIGDYHLKPFVTSEPEVTVTERTDDDDCLILASDGLWDVVSNTTACEVARMCLRAGEGGKGSPAQPEEVEGERDKQGGSSKACIDAAILLTRLALARHSTDNVSVVVVDLRRRSSEERRKYLGSQFEQGAES